MMCRPPVLLGFATGVCLLGVASCSTEDPVRPSAARVNANQSASPLVLHHPAGIIDHVDTLPTRPCGIAVSKTDLMYVAEIDAGSITSGLIVPGTFTKTFTSGGTHPCTMQFSPNGATAYVSNQDSPNVVVIRVDSSSITKTITMPVSPLSMLRSHSGDKVYVSGNNSRLYVIKTSTNTLSDSLTVTGGGVLFGLAVSNNDSVVFVGSRNGGTVTAFNTISKTVIRTYTGATSIQNLALSPDGTRLYATDIDGGSLRAWNVATGALVTTVSLGAGTLPFDVQVTKDGVQLYVSQAGNGHVVALTRSTLVVADTVIAGGSPRYIGFDSTGAHAAVTNDQGWVTFIK